MSIPRRLVFVLIIAASLTIEAFGSCPVITPGPPCHEYWRADAVFTGVATRVVPVADTTQLAFGPYSSTTVYFSVEEIFKGVKGGAIVLELDYCGHSFKEGERYLVYAHRNTFNKKLNVRAGSTRTRLLSEAKEDLEYIRSTAMPELGARLFGKVEQRILNIRKSEFEAESLKNIKVTLEGNNQQREALTDGEGRYEFKGLSPGTYQIRADVPAPLSSGSKTVKVTGRACVALDISARHRGRIAGSVVDMNGRPLVAVPVSLVSAETNLEEFLSENNDKNAWSWQLTNQMGRYVFSYLAPGRYLLLINRSELERSQGSEAARVLPRLFYPGVSETTGATVIVVRADDHKPGDYEFRLPIRE